MNPQILVDMIVCRESEIPGLGVHRVRFPCFTFGEPYACGTCMWCGTPVFSDLKLKPSFVNGPMSRYTDVEGHLWVSLHPTFIIQEEPV